MPQQHFCQRRNAQTTSPGTCIVLLKSGYHCTGFANPAVQHVQMDLVCPAGLGFKWNLVSLLATPRGGLEPGSSHRMLLTGQVATLPLFPSHSQGFAKPFVMS
jgi:hypothetical protein